MYLSPSVSFHGLIAHFREGAIYIEELARALVGGGKSEICRAGRQAGNFGRNQFCGLESKHSLGAEFLPLWGPQSFLLRLSTDWMRPSTLWKIVCVSQSLLIEMVITSKKYLHSNIYTAV